jgi:hypothetical protein
VSSKADAHPHTLARPVLAGSGRFRASHAGPRVARCSDSMKTGRSRRSMKAACEIGLGEIWMMTLSAHVSPCRPWVGPAHTAQALGLANRRPQGRSSRRPAVRRLRRGIVVSSTAPDRSCDATVIAATLTIVIRVVNPRHPEQPFRLTIGSSKPVPIPGCGDDRRRKASMAPAWEPPLPLSRRWLRAGTVTERCFIVCCGSGWRH